MAVDVEFLNGNNVNNINNNFQRVKNALQEVVGRNGNLPNHMNADLDMNSNDILNVDGIDLQRIVVDGEEFDPRQMRGWSPVFAAIEYNGTIVMELVDYVGGYGIKPTQYIGWYVGSTGYVQNINQATGFGSSGVSDGNKGDVIVSNSGSRWKLAKEVDTFSELATKFVYSDPEEGQQIVTPGDVILWREKGFSYKVAAFDAVDAHLDYYGDDGVKLYVLASANRFVPEQFGAEGDFDKDTWTGTDDTDAFKAMVTALTKHSRVVLSGVYRLTDVVTVTVPASWEWLPGAEVINDCIDLPGAGTYPTLIACIEWRGSDEKYTATLAANVAKGVRSFDVPDASNIQAGDILFLSSSAIINDAGPSIFRKGEWVSVSSVSGNTVTLNEVVYDTYLTSDGAAVSVRTPIKGLRLLNPTITNTPGYYLEGIRIEWFSDLYVGKGRFYGGEKGLLSRNGVDVIFEDCGAWDINEQQGYALQFASVRNGRMIRPHGSNCRHLCEISSRSKYTYVIDSSGESGSGAMINWHPGPEENFLIGGRIPDGSYVSMRGQRNHVQDVNFEGFLRIGELDSSTTITAARAGEDLRITNCIFRGLGNTGDRGGKISVLHPITNGVFSGNLIDIPRGNGIASNCLVPFKGCSWLHFISNTFVDGVPAQFIYDQTYTIPAAPTTYQGVVFRGNSGTLDGPLFIQSSVDINTLTVADNVLAGLASVTQLLSNNSASKITGLVFENNRLSGGYTRLTGNQTSDWGAIVSRGNVGDLPSVWETTTYGSGYAEIAVLQGERTVPSGFPMFVCTPSAEGTAVAGYEAKIDRYNYVSGILQSVRFQVFNASGVAVGAGIKAVITRLR